MANRTTLASKIISQFEHDHSFLLHGDNLNALRACPDNRFALFYLDPPFFTGKTRTQKTTTQSKIEYEDRWTGGRDEYLEWLRLRLIEVKRVLTENGSLFLHLDTHASHYVKIELDRIFGEANFINEIIWHYTGGGRSTKRFSNKHDTIFWYGKTNKHIFHIDAVREPYQLTSGYARSGIVGKSGKKYLPHPDGTPADDVWNIAIVNPMSNERSDYPTQKPELLLERIITVASNPRDWVGDFCAGSGTTCLAAERVGRKWVGCDESTDAIRITNERFAKEFPKLHVEVIEAGKSVTNR